MSSVILVNGVPASGKSTVARELSLALNVPVLGLDTVKEALFSELGIGDRLYNRKMGRASYAAIWALVGTLPPGSTVIVDAWFGFAPLDLLHRHLSQARVDRICEVWCHAAPDLVVQRYLQRCTQRHSGHLGAEYAPELQALALRAEPLGLGTTIEIDTTFPVVIKSFLPLVQAALSERPADPILDDTAACDRPMIRSRIPSSRKRS